MYLLCVLGAHLDITASERYVVRVILDNLILILVLIPHHDAEGFGIAIMRPDFELAWLPIRRQLVVDEAFTLEINTTITGDNQPLIGSRAKV